MTMTDKTTTGEEVAARLDEYAPADVRANWTSLAAMLERRQAELAYLIQRLQEAHAAQAVGSERLYLRLEDTWTDALDDGLREASGFERLTTAVFAAKLWPSVESRDRTAEERDLIEQGMARGNGGQS